MSSFFSPVVLLRGLISLLIHAVVFVKKSVCLWDKFQVSVIVPCLCWPVNGWRVQGY